LGELCLEIGQSGGLLCGFLLGLLGWLFTRANMQQPTLTAPVDKLKLVTAYPKARATMNDARLRTLAPVGTPIVLHLYTG